ncbi:hypothetical protein DY000_02040900 [Brassica cretica]|uniref:DUF4283 domain-containing protein n=1 Tax=Brassica cretica TaxID=69181 RepID=A0ABQ7BD33_BRACR|nr:hypothetical protein DY000_02040900 [Brassica cretica]
MVDLPICCSEHDVSMCFSEHGGTPLMSWRSWPEPASRFVRNLALAAVELMSSGHGRRGPLPLGRINHSAWKQEAGPKPGGGDPDPGPGTQTRGQRPGSRRGEPGTWRQEPGSQKLETSARSQGHQNLLSIVLGCTCARSERIHSLIGDVWSGEWAIDLQTCFNGHVFGLSEDDHMDVVILRILMAWKWIIRKNHHDETLPPWWGLVGVGQKFDGEAGNVCIKGDASAHTPDACASPDPRILRGRILARLRIKGMRRFNKTRRPKLGILMFVSTSRACAS